MVSSLHGHDALAGAQPDMWQEGGDCSEPFIRPVSDTTILPLFNVAFYRQFFYRPLVSFAHVFVVVVHGHGDLLPFLAA